MDISPQGDLIPAGPEFYRGISLTDGDPPYHSARFFRTEQLADTHAWGLNSHTVDIWTMYLVENEDLTYIRYGLRPRDFIIDGFQTAVLKLHNRLFKFCSPHDGYVLEMDPE